MRPLLALVLLLACGLAPGQELDELRRKPITTAPGKVGDLLRQWWQEGTAAGNAGDWYDNRDDGHSHLDTAPFPQLPARRLHGRGQAGPPALGPRRARPRRVTFGNSSTSAPPELDRQQPARPITLPPPA